MKTAGSFPATIPQDPDIPALAAFAQIGLDPVLTRVGISGPFSGAQLIRHVPGSRATFRVESADGPVAVKAYRKSPARTIAVLKALELSGLADGKSPTAARLLGFDLFLRFSVTSWFQGLSGWDLIHEKKGRRAGEIAAQWLVAAHDAAIATDRVYNPAQVLEYAHRWATTISISQPALDAKAAACTLRLGARMPGRGRPGLRHGAFGLRHVFDLGDGPGVIDWDSPKYGAVEVDAATFLAKLSNYVIRFPRLAQEAQRTSDAFLTGVSGIVKQSDLLWYEAASCLKCATYRSKSTTDPSKRHVEALLDRAAAALDARH